MNAHRCFQPPPPRISLPRNFGWGGISPALPIAAWVAILNAAGTSRCVFPDFL